MTAELGRQPWLVYGVMRTADGVSRNVSAGNGLFVLLGFLGMYALLGILLLFLLSREIEHGPGPRTREPADGDRLVRPHRVHADGRTSSSTGSTSGSASSTSSWPADEEERRAVLKTIGPVWDGNEVWLIGAGGALVLAFPTLYAASFSGFFLPLMIVLWLLMGRGISMEFRNHVDHPVWRPFWDVAFSVSSALLAIFFGAALGNVVRGVPLDASGEFFAPLWTDLPARTSDRDHRLVHVAGRAPRLLPP